MILQHFAIKEFVNTLQQLKKSPFLLVVAALIDAASFIAYGFFTTSISDRIVAQGVLLTNQVSSLLAQGKQGILYLLFQNPIRPLTGKLLMLLALLFVVTFIVYTAFQATSWYFAHHIAGRKPGYKNYVLTFAKLNLFWTALYILYKILDTYFGLRYVVIKKFSPEAYNMAGIILFMLLVIALIAAAFSYATLNTKTLFRTPLKKTIPLLLVCAIIFLNAQFLINQAAKVNIDFGLVFGIVLLFPVIIFLKTYLVNCLDHAQH
ncbi:hypothetical protein HY489_02815 [Candidatus Woesearchaeota archaeon]|nr:hypothetical protein [Candidatus Woesearchaeota archaeon]